MNRGKQNFITGNENLQRILFQTLPSESGEPIKDQSQISASKRWSVADVSGKSIFDLRINGDSNKSVTLPQISTTVASQIAKIRIPENNFEQCALPSIPINGLELQQTSKSPVVQKRPKAGLFDFRERAIQEKARAKHIRRLRKRGYEIPTHTESTTSRFISNPYEGAVDDYAVIRRKSKSTVDSGKQPQVGSTSATKVTFSPPADEETLEKIEIAFSEWKLRKEILAEKSLGSRRKRSSSHSPRRSTPEIFSLHQLSNSCSPSFEFLNHCGNIRRQPGTPKTIKHIIRIKRIYYTMV